MPYPKSNYCFGQSMLHRMEVLDNESRDCMTYTGNARWMIPYADLMTLLFGLFLALYALGSLHPDQTNQINRNINPVSHLSSPSNQQSINSLNNTDSDLPKNMQLIETKFQGENGIRVSKQQRGIVISVLDSVLFQPGRADLSLESKNTLDRLADILKQTHHPISVEGHTDNSPISTGQFPSNWELSTSRATNIVKYLIDQRHFDPARLSSAGYSEFRPVASNSSFEGKQKNRRVDIVILNN